MFLIISKDKRIPIDLLNFEYEQWDLEEFIVKANEGLNVDEGLYINIDSVTKELYDGLKTYSDNGVVVVYYRFDDQNVKLDFTIDDGVTIYEIKKKDETKEEEKQLDDQLIDKSKIEDPEDKLPLVKENGLEVIGNVSQVDSSSDLNITLLNSIDKDELDIGQSHRKGKSAITYVFGCAKGGVGKTTTCAMCAREYGLTHPNEKIAIADFDIADGQFGTLINRFTPTIANLYQKFITEKEIDFNHLYSCSVKSEYFSPNVDIYLTPSMDIDEITKTDKFWNTYLKLLLSNYDVVFFDTSPGSSYYKDTPINKLYKIADRLLLICSTDSTATKSFIRQLKVVGGIRKTDGFTKEDDILNKTRIILTKVTSDKSVNAYIGKELKQYANIIAVFGNIDDLIHDIQWYQRWEKISENELITKYLRNICDMSK